jgi:tripartite-type tricarboxylate transporter receptor subunit TctC
MKGEPLVKMTRRHVLQTLAGSSLMSSVRAQGQPASTLSTSESAYPVKPIRYIVPVAAGGGSDMVGRTVCERWAKALGQTIVVDNQGGGGGVIACQNTARATPDGYVLMQGYVATLGTSPATRRNLPYDPLRDFTPVGMIGSTPNVLVISPQVPAQSIAELVTYLRETRVPLSYGSAGQGSLTHLTMELFRPLIQSSMVHVPYRGIAPAFTDLMAGQTQLMFPGLAAALPHIRSGRVRPLAVTGLKRHPQLKDTPTLDEAGFKGFEAEQWYGVVGPAGLPGPVVKLLNETLAGVLGSPDLREKLSVEAIEPRPMTPDVFGHYIRSDLERWTRLAKDRRIQLDS